MSDCNEIILNTGEQVAPERRRRQWVDLGTTMAVAGFLLLPMLVDEDETAILLLDSNSTQLGPPLPLAPMSVEPTAPYRVIPRALRANPAGTPLSVLLETQYTGDDKPGWATRREDENHEYIQPLPDPS